MRLFRRVGAVTTLRLQVRLSAALALVASVADRIRHQTVRHPSRVTIVMIIAVRGCALCSEIKYGVIPVTVTEFDGVSVLDVV